jgi:phage gpG-like protein
MDLTVSQTGAELAARLLGRTGKRLDDPRPGLRLVFDYLREIETQQFATGGRARGGGWDENHPLTAKRKGHSRPLVASKRLMRSLTGKRGAGARRDVSRTEAHFGTKVWYARFVVKRRPFLVFDRRDRRAIKRILRSYVLTGEAA